MATLPLPAATNAPAPVAMPKKTFTTSQLVNILSLVAMTLFVAFVQWASSRHIYIPPIIVGLAGLATAAVTGTCRSFLTKFAGDMQAAYPEFYKVFQSFLALQSQKAATSAVVAATATVEAASLASVIPAAPLIPATPLTVTQGLSRDELLAALAQMGGTIPAGVTPAPAAPPTTVTIDPLAVDPLAGTDSNAPPATRMAEQALARYAGNGGFADKT